MSQIIKQIICFVRKLDYENGIAKYIKLQLLKIKLYKSQVVIPFL